MKDVHNYITQILFSCKKYIIFAMFQLKTNTYPFKSIMQQLYIPGLTVYKSI